MHHLDLTILSITNGNDRIFTDLRDNYNNNNKVVFLTIPSQNRIDNHIDLCTRCLQGCRREHRPKKDQKIWLRTWKHYLNRNDKNNIAYLKHISKCTILELVYKGNKNIWARIPSGWICTITIIILPARGTNKKARGAIPGFFILAEK